MYAAGWLKDKNQPTNTSHQVAVKIDYIGPNAPPSLTPVAALVVYRFVCTSSPTGLDSIIGV